MAEAEAEALGWPLFDYSAPPQVHPPLRRRVSHRVCATAPSYTPLTVGGERDGRRVRCAQCVYASVDAYTASQPRAGPQVPQRVQPIDPDELSAGELGQWQAAHTTAPSLLTACSPHPAHRPNHFLKVRQAGGLKP